VYIYSYALSQHSSLYDCNDSVTDGTSHYKNFVVQIK